MAHEAGTTIRTFARILIDFAEEHELGDIRAANPAVICEPFATLQAASTRLATAPWRAKFQGFCHNEFSIDANTFEKCTTNRLV